MAKNWNLQERLNRQEVANQQTQGAMRVAQALNGGNVGTGFAQKFQMVDLPINRLHAHPEQNNFSMDEGELETLVASVKVSGVLQPIIVRVHPQIPGEFEIIAGHRRCEAAKRCGMEKIPAQVCAGMTDDDARTVFYATNMGQRQELLPSERAKGYAALASALHVDGGMSAEEIAQIGNESKRTVYFYLRLTRLIPELLEWVDDKDKKLSTRVGYVLSDLSETAQNNLMQVLKKHKANGLSEKQAKEIVELLRHDEPSIERCLYPERKKKVTKNTKLVFPSERFGKYFEGIDGEKAQLDLIEEALRLYFEGQN